MDLIEILAIFTLLTNIFVVYFVAAFLLKKFFGKDFFYKGMARLLEKNANEYGFIIALIATLGSLYLSEVRGFTPCTFCWYQRILMYPNVALFAVAIYRWAKDVYFYVLPLAVFGILMSAYHYYHQLNPQPLAPCSAIGFSISCSDRFFTHYGFITIPWMAFSAFVLITLLMLLSRAKLNKGS